MLDLCTFGAESRLGPFGGCFFTGGWPTGEKMNHQIMDRWAMLKYQAIHGKTFVSEVPHASQEDFFSQKNKAAWIPNQYFHMIFFLY